MKLLGKLGSVVLGTVVCWQAACATELEVLHWWTAPSETKALSALQQAMHDKGYQWKNFAIAGGGGAEAINVLKSRIISGNPPSAAQIKGKTIQKWGSLGLLDNVNDITVAQEWDKVLPKPLLDSFKVDGKYVAVPLNIHRINWMWVNPKPFIKINKPIPATWQQFIALAPELKKQGYIPLILGNEDWQYTTLFEAVVLGTQGVDFYRKALVELDDQTLSGQQMLQVFHMLAKIRAILPNPAPNYQWDQAIRQVISGKAAIQLTGDWAQGEMEAAGKAPGKDVYCLPAPGTGNAFIYTSDTMVLFPSSNKEKKKNGQAFAETLMNPEVQKSFNQLKGSIPARQDIALEEFNSCSQTSHFDFQKSIRESTLLPSLVHSTATDDRVQRSVFEVVDYFFKHPEVSAEQAAKHLATTIQASY